MALEQGRLELVQSNFIMGCQGGLYKRVVARDIVISHSRPTPRLIFDTYIYIYIYIYIFFFGKFISKYNALLVNAGRRV